MSSSVTILMNGDLFSAISMSHMLTIVVLDLCMLSCTVFINMDRFWGWCRDSAIERIQSAT